MVIKKSDNKGMANWAQDERQDGKVENNLFLTISVFNEDIDILLLLNLNYFIWSFCLHHELLNLQAHLFRNLLSCHSFYSLFYLLPQQYCFCWYFHSFACLPRYEYWVLSSHLYLFHIHNLFMDKNCTLFHQCALY